jgi:hypothetical protein
LARNIASRLTLALETSDNTPKKDFDMDKLTRATHELHLINSENERSAAENTKLLAQLTALASAELTKKGKVIFTQEVNMSTLTQVHQAPFGHGDKKSFHCKKLTT